MSDGTIFSVNEAHIYQFAQEILDGYVPDHEIHSIVEQLANDRYLRFKLSSAVTEILCNELRQYLPLEQRQ